MRRFFGILLLAVVGVSTFSAGTASAHGTGTGKHHHHHHGRHHHHKA